MKNISFLFLLLLILFFQSCSINQVDTKFRISASIKGLDKDQAVLAMLDLNTNEGVGLDTVDVQNGKFIFEGEIESPYLHTIKLLDNKKSINLFLEAGDITISGDISNIDSLVVTGSKEDSLMRSSDFYAIFDKQKGLDAILNNPSMAYGAFTAFYYFQVHQLPADSINLILDSFYGNARKSVYYDHLVTLCKSLVQTSPGSFAPDFSSSDTTGSTVSISDFRGKYVLLDFWASWCPGCRKITPEYQEVYDRFAGDRFEIIGISFDKDEEKWKQAIQEDSIQWINVSNLQGWDSVSVMYGVRSVPQNFLLDTNGMIMLKNVEPHVIRDTLNSLINTHKKSF